MPPRRGGGRTTRHSTEESRDSDSDEGIQKNIPLRRRERQAEVEDVTRQIGEMELVLARFLRTNPPTFAGAEGGLMAEDNAQCWWRGTSRILRESGAVITWESFCAAFIMRSAGGEMSTLVNGTVAGDRWIERSGFVVSSVGDNSREGIC
ncbi:Retrotransposon protein [Dorcoceras hygrometricum]|uniref:Retrotransposon protein n=1 Tax=Dorcoceras hygrometricum TaxID=472368 RepID=A0A2Z7B5K9_9LAMI|nr:Retrotransposon protein [Dorcoceras hygrometricum]